MYDVRNPGPGLGQAQNCGGVKPVHGTPTLHSWQGSPMPIHIQCTCILVTVLLKNI